MRNPTGKKLDKLIFGMFDQMIEGVDQYNHSGSLWLIFTNERQWVVEYTEGGTLWYNYKLFKNEMELVGMDCVEDKKYITRWFEERFLNKPKVEDTIQNGVKKTLGERMNRDYSVKDIVENGIKNTYSDILPQEYDMSNQFDVEDTIENGVKETELKSGRQTGKVEDTIQNGVKHTNLAIQTRSRLVEDTIQNGVKRTRSGNFFNTIERIEYTIENGEKIELK